MAELDGEPFVAFDPDLSIRRAIDRFLRRHDVQVDVVLEFDNIENIKRAVEIPSGVSILPEPSLAHEVKAGTLVAIPIEGDDSERPSHSPTGDRSPAAGQPRARGGQVSGACCISEDVTSNRVGFVEPHRDAGQRVALKSAMARCSRAA